MSQEKNKFQQNVPLLISLAISSVFLFAPVQSHLNIAMTRWLTILSLIISYTLFTKTILRQHQEKHPTPTSTKDIQQDDLLIIYASQTGYAEQLATQTFHSLQQGQVKARLCDIRHVSGEMLQQTKRTLFIVSTTGEGDAPDSAAKFTRSVMSQQLALQELRYAVLVLGDRNYQAFCAFGHQLDHWLHQQGAQTMFDTVEVDNGDAGALRHWQHHLGQISGKTDLADWHPAEYESWTLTGRQHLNPGSKGNAVYQIFLTPPNDKGTWQAGDIAEILPRRPGVDSALPHREYSIASIPKDGAVELIVRQMQQADGSLGWGSGWLTQYASIGESIALRLRSNSSFHPPQNSSPIILIGNGTGIAGLRAHLKYREQEGAKQNWLFFGERQRAHDFFCQTEIERWKATGLLSKIDLAFSRDQEQRIYVQDRLHQQADELRHWVANGAAIYVCGSLEGMAGGVDHALREILGDDRLERLREEGMYRRDVY